VTDGEDHEPMTSPPTNPGNCMCLIEDEQDSGSEARVTTSDNGTTEGNIEDEKENPEAITISPIQPKPNMLTDCAWELVLAT